MSYNGFINLNKEIGGSSQNAVTAIKRLLHEKVGHCGTLDPLAGGVLPVCVGKATRLADLVMNGGKTYIGTVCFGRATESYDAGGDVIEETDASFVTREMVEQAIPAFIGDIEQKAPVISALKKDGVPLYKRARRGEQVEAPRRNVHIDNIRLLEFIPGSLAYAKIEVDCGHGVYIRSLANDLGRAIGVPAYLSGLLRSKVGNFRLEDAYSPRQIEEMLARGDMSFIRSMEQEIAFLPAVAVDDNRIYGVSHGNDVHCCRKFAEGQQVQVTDHGGNLLALGIVSEDNRGKKVKIKKVFIEPRQDIVCAIGNFDGLHLGHRALFEALAQKKKELGCRSAVLTFSPHPLKLICGKAPLLLTGEQLKNELLVEYFGVDKVITLDFDEQTMNSSPEEFVDDIIVNKLKAAALVVGYNFTFAKEGAGDARLLKRLCAERGVDVVIVDEVAGEFGTVSSTNIRSRLAEGDLAAVNEMLGYWFVMEGTVIKGNQIGRTIGFPTANFKVATDQAVPPRGVYAVRIDTADGSYEGVANFGFKPTIGGETEPLVEVNLFDADIDLYGKDIRIWLGRFLRAERKFSGLEELKQEIALNSRQSREFLAQTPENKHLPKKIR